MRIAMTSSALLLLLIPCVTAQVAQTASSDGSAQLRFVAQLSVSGCTLIVHDTGASDSSHLEVDPIVCVAAKGLHKVVPRYDPVIQQTYLSVPVMLRDDAMIAEVSRQLRHLSPKTVMFSAVSAISVSTDNSSKFQALEFIWSREETVGYLRLACKPKSENCSVGGVAKGYRMFKFDVLDQVLLSASVISNGVTMQLTYRIKIQNHSFNNPEFYFRRYSSLPKCRHLRFVRSIRLNGCTARVHQKLDVNGHFLIEPLFCHSIINLSNESVKYDYSRDMHYLKLDLVLQDDAILDTVRTQLADLSPRSVTFMQLWQAPSNVTSVFSRRFEIGPLMVSRDWRSAELRVYCRNAYGCEGLRLAIIAEPTDLWRHVEYSLTSLISNRYVLTSDRPVNPWRIQERPTDRGSKVLMAPDGRWFITFQQQMTDRVSFKRTWDEYLDGFGDETDFWIGLSAIHSLSKNGATLRVEIKLWNGTELHAEYAGFKVADASTNFTMTYHYMLRDRSSILSDAMVIHDGMQFSTMDRDNDYSANRSCSHIVGGLGGWWFHECHLCNPNGIYHYGNSDRAVRFTSWYINDVEKWVTLREVRLMLQV